MKKFILIVGIVMILLVSGCNTADSKERFDCEVKIAKEFCKENNCIYDGHYMDGSFKIFDKDTRTYSRHYVHKSEIDRCMGFVDVGGKIYVEVE